MHLAEVHTNEPTFRLTAHSSRNDSLGSLDAARVVAVLAIIWIHTIRSVLLTPSTVLGRFAVPFFVAAAVLLVVRSAAQKPTRTFLQYTIARTRRLLVPFVAWTVVYWCFKLIKRMLLPQAPNDLPGWESLFLGSAYHLWFLPFLWVVSLIAFAAARTVSRIGPSKLPAGVAATAALFLCLIPATQTSFAWEGVWYMWLSLPAAIGAFSISLIWSDSPELFTGRSTQRFAFAILLLAMLALDHHNRSPFAESLAGLSCLLLAISTPPGIIARRLGHVAPIVLGMYLTHLLILKIGEAAADRLAVPIGPASDGALFLATVLGAAGLAWALSRPPRLRWMV